MLTPAALDDQAAAIEVGQQNTALAELAERLDRRWETALAPRMRPLPKDVPISELDDAALHSRRFAIAVDEVSVAPVEIDLGRTPTFVVVGPDESGKSTTLAAIAQQFSRAWPEAPRYLLAGRRSPLTQGAGLWTEVAVGAEAAGVLLQQMTSTIGGRAADGFVDPMLLVVDDADTFGEGVMRNLLDETQPLWRDSGIIVAVALGTFAASKMYAPWFKSMISARHGILLTPDLSNDGAIFDRRLPQRGTTRTPTGSRIRPDVLRLRTGASCAFTMDGTHT